MRTLAEWRVWYADGSSYSSKTTQWNDLPQFGVTYLLLLYSDGSRAGFNGGDYYWNLGEIFANDNNPEGLLRQLPFVKFGKWQPIEEFDRVVNQAKRVGTEWHTQHYKPQPGG